MTTPADTKERVYFKGEGELIVKRIMHKGAGAKVFSFLAAGPVGYIAFGRDKKRKSRASGTLVVTNRAIYCAGNDYPFDEILSITKEGHLGFETLILTFERGEGGGESGKIFGPGMTVEMEMKTDDCDALTRALEQAKMANVSFVVQCRFCQTEMPWHEIWCPNPDCHKSQI